MGENPTVRLPDGRVIPIHEVNFGDYETQAMYEVAADFSDSANANRFLQLFRESGWEAPEFLQLYRDVLIEDMQGGADDGGQTYAAFDPAGGGGALKSSLQNGTEPLSMQIERMGGRASASGPAYTDVGYVNGAGTAKGNAPNSHLSYKLPSPTETKRLIELKEKELSGAWLTQKEKAELARLEAEYIDPIRYANSKESVIIRAADTDGLTESPDEPSIDDLLNAVLTPEQRLQKDKIANLILGMLSLDQQRRLGNGEDLEEIIKELDPLQQAQITASIADVKLMTNQQQLDFAYLQSMLLDGLTVAERLAILQHLNENGGQLTPADLKKIAADASAGNAEGDFFKEVNQLPEDSAQLFDDANFFRMPYRFARVGTTFEELNAEYMAQKASEAFALATLSVANAVGAAVTRKMFFSPGKIPGGQQQGATGNSGGSQAPAKPPEGAGNPGGPAAGAGEEIIYSANGDLTLRSQRRPAFDGMMKDGFEIDGNQYKLNEHAYNSLFKSGRKDIMPADIYDALKAQPLPGNAGSVEYVNPATGTSVFVNPAANEVVGIWPAGFLK